MVKNKKQLLPPTHVQSQIFEIMIIRLEIIPWFIFYHDTHISFTDSHQPNKSDLQNYSDVVQKLGINPS